MNDRLTDEQLLQRVTQAGELLMQARKELALRLVPSPSLPPTTGTTPPSSPTPAPTVPLMSWGKRFNLPERQFVAQMAVDFGRPPDDFMDCMAFETGETFSPSVRNPHSSATGLIQFMDATCVELSKRWKTTVTTASLAKMTRIEQLAWVWKYFKMQIERVGMPQSLEDVYMLIYWPSAVGRPLDSVLHGAGTDAYRVNKGLDVNADGQITKREAGQLVRAKSAKGRLPENYG